MDKKFYSCYVAYGKAKRYYANDFVQADTAESYIKFIEEEARRNGYKKQLEFSFSNPFIAYNIGKKNCHCFGAYNNINGKDAYSGVDCEDSKNLVEPKKVITISAIG